MVRAFLIPFFVMFVRIFMKRMRLHDFFYKTMLVVCVCALPAIFAGDDQEFFLRAHTYYAEKNYDAALKMYDMITHKGSAVLYNMGNCFFYKDDYPHALVYWSRAEAGASSSEYNLIQHNKELVFKRLGMQRNIGWLKYGIEYVRHQPYVSLFILQILFLIFWWLLLLAMRKKQNGLQKTVRAFLCVCVMIFGFIISVEYSNYGVQSAIIAKKEGKLLAGPDNSFPVLSSLMYADCAAIKEVRDGWYKVQYADKIGWIEADGIHLI